MLNKLKYLPVEWRHSDEPCTPVGRRPSQAKQIEVALDDNRLRFKAPRHMPTMGSTEQRKPHRAYTLYDGGFRSYNRGVMATDYWRHKGILFREWGFWGPWFMGHRASLSLAVTIICRDERHEYQDISFFHPKAFENVLVDYFNDLYGQGKRWSTHYGPVNWQPKNNLPVFSVECDIHKAVMGRISPDKYQSLLFPISDKHFVEICLIHNKVATTSKTGEYLVDTKNVVELADFIINNVELELGPQTQQRYNQVIAESNGATLSKTFAPLKWPTNPTNATEDEPNQDIPGLNHNR